MTQRPRASLLEAAVQAAIGLPVGFVVSFSVGLLQLPPAGSASLIAGAMFLASMLRGYVIRRRFDRERVR